MNTHHSKKEDYNYNKKKTKLSLEPIQINENVWYYEEKKGITVVHRIYNSEGKYGGTYQMVIPWSKLRKSVANSL